MTVGNCGRCAAFRRIEFTEESQPVVCCKDQAEGSAKDRVQDVVRVPVICTAADTALGVILPYLQLDTSLEAIPVLDREARPIGVITVREARRLVASGISLEIAMAEVMSHRVVCVLPETSLDYAAELIRESETAQICVVAADGTFLGLVSSPDLPTTNQRRC